jgi:leucyl-tRNA synthetase
MEYDFRAIEKKWQDEWRKRNTYRVTDDNSKPKFYVLDMFPYPSGAGLHVGHPLGFIASDIYARYKRLNGFNVLHPMGYDAFGLPAEQYAIQTGRHPAETTQENITRYREQLDKIGFSFDWDRQVKTCEPDYYKWTQWIFLQLFKSWYNCKTKKAESIDTLIAVFQSEGFHGEAHEYLTGDIEHDVQPFTAADWSGFSEKQKSDILMNFRMAYLSEAWVNWCPQLGTVLANDEVKDGVSERGGYPVERKRMPQWSMRITAYADRLLKDLDTLDWSESMKDAQRNWIGKSEGTSIRFKLEKHDGVVEVFTTRPDTVFGVSFVTLAPEHELVNVVTTDEYRAAVNAYVNVAKNKSERERQADVKTVSGQFTGAYVLHPFTGARVPVWIGEYVLAGYGTGAVMAVPGHDSRDHAFAKHFGLPITQVVQPKEGTADVAAASYDEKEGTCINSDFLNGLEVKAAIRRAIEEIEKRGFGKGKINFRLRDAAFGRQRYWGEPIPIYYKDGIPTPLSENELPLVLPEVDKFLPTETGEPPLARAKDWKYNGQYDYEWTTMPGWAGSSWYFLRYMDPKNGNAFASADAINYWKQVDLYIGGAEHATGHLLYVRFWTKFLYDIGKIPVEEPAKKLVNQGMIQGTSQLVYRINGTNEFVSFGLRKEFDTTALHVDVNMVDNNVLDLERFKTWRPEFADATFKLEDGKYICGSEVEKMSKRWHNVVNPDSVCDQYGADTLRMYEMFLGPLDQAKPWNTNGISGVHNFLRRYWRLFHDAQNNFSVSDETPSKAELKTLHKALKKLHEDIERMAFNTGVSTFMIACNELTDLKCNKRAVLEPLTIALSTFAPHIAEELWEKLGHSNSITAETFPAFDELYLAESSFDYPVQINGKVRFKQTVAVGLSPADIEKEVMSGEEIQKWLEGKAPKKVIVVPNRIINIVV